MEKVSASRELDGADLHGEPQKYFAFSESPPQLLGAHLWVLEVDRQRAVVGTFRATDDEVRLVPYDALADALTVRSKEGVLGYAVLVLFQVEGGAGDQPHARNAAAHSL